MLVLTYIIASTIHPLTRYAMNYLSFMSEYKEVLMNIMVDAPLIKWAIDITHLLLDDLVGFFGDFMGMMMNWVA